jgi:hypothetical protein
VIVLLAATAASFAGAPDTPPAEPPKAKIERLQLQPLDEPIERLEPATPRTETDQKRIDAMAWYMTGQIKETKGDPKGALDAYRKAV